MQTELTQTLIESKLKTNHVHINVYPLNNYPSNKPYEYMFNSMNGKITMYLYTNSTQNVYSQLYKWSGNSWHLIIDHRIEQGFFHHKESRTWDHDISQGFYKWRAYTSGNLWQSEQQTLWVYKTYNENQIKGNEIRIIDDSFLGYLPAARTEEITLNQLNNGQICTY